MTKRLPPGLVISIFGLVVLGLLGMFLWDRGDARLTALFNPSSLDYQVPGLTATEGHGLMGRVAERDAFVAEAEFEDVEVHGRVVDESGRPLAGARVRAYSGADIAVRYGQEQRWSEDELGVADVHAVRSNEQGRFVLSLEREVGGEVLWYIHQDDFVERSGVAEGGETLLLDLGVVTLSGGVTLVGNVRNSEGRPVAGAEIRKVFPKHNHYESGLGRVPVTVTGLNGSFRASSFELGRTELWASAPGYVAEARVLIVLEANDGIDFVLKPSLEIVGRVQGGDKEESIEVVAWQTEDPRVERRVLCDKEGFFKVEGLKEDDGAFLLQATGIRRLGSPRPTSVALTSNVRALPGATGVVLEVIKPTGFRLQVTDARTGHGLEAEVVVRAPSLYGMPYPVPTEVIAEENGDVVAFALMGRLGASSDSKAALWINRRGYESVRIRDLEPLPGTIVEIGQVRLKRIEPRQVHVVGRADGKSIAEALVETCLDPDSIGYDFNSYEERVSDAPAERLTFVPQRSGSTTNEDGLALLFVDGTGSVGITVTHPDHTTLRVRTSVKELTGGYPLQLGKGGSIAVRCLDENGEPMVDSIVQAYWEGPGNDEGFTTEPTDDEGTAHFNRLGPGAHRFSVLGDRTAMTVEIMEGGEHALLLERAQRARLHGLVTENGRPLAAANILHSLDDHWTNRDGRYSIEGLSLGRNRIGVSHPMYGEIDAYDLYLEELDVVHDIELQFATVSGTIAFGSGEPAANAYVQLEIQRSDGMFDEWATRSWGRMKATTSSIDGAYQFEHVRVRAGLFVAVYAEEAPPARMGPLVFVEGATEHVRNVTVLRGARVEVQLLDWNSDGPPEIEAHWMGGDSIVGDDTVRRSKNIFMGESEITEAGIWLIVEARYVFAGLEPGPWRIEAHDPSAIFREIEDDPDSSFAGVRVPKPGLFADVELSLEENPEVVLRADDAMGYGNSNDRW